MINASFFNQENFMPHGMCYLWRPDILWTSVISDVITALAYFSITAAIIIFVKKRHDLPYPWFFILAGSIIFVACGLSHLISAIVIWEPIYGISAISKAITAITSLATGIAIWFVLPFFLKLPSPAMLEEKNAALEQSLMKLKITHSTILESQRLASLTNLMAGMAHELNTPMGTSLTATSYIDHELGRLKLEEMTKSEFEKMTGNIKQGLKLVIDNLTKSANLVSIFKQVAVSESVSEK
jgi:signal transduction histidine kinase